MRRLLTLICTILLAACAQPYEPFSVGGKTQDEAATECDVALLPDLFVAAALAKSPQNTAPDNAQIAALYTKQAIAARKDDCMRDKGFSTTFE